MVRTAAQLIRTKGVSGTGLREVVEAAGAPRGSLQHYFPEGKDQLVSEALLWMGSVAARRVDRVLSKLAAPSASALFAGTVDLWRKEFVTLGFAGGCPLVAAAADVAATSDELRAVIARAFEGWVEPMTAALIQTGVPEERAGTLATLVISALEGAIILSRIRRDTGPLDAVEKELGPLLDAAIPRDRRG
jgi:AcrR family transcriptional regulator